MVIKEKLCRVSNPQEGGFRFFDREEEEEGKNIEENNGQKLHVSPPLALPLENSQLRRDQSVIISSSRAAI